MEVRKIFRAGNSTVVSLPMSMLKTLGLKEGFHVSVEINREEGEIILKPVVVKKNTLSLDFVRLVDKLLIECEYSIRRLKE